MSQLTMSYLLKLPMGVLAVLAMTTSFKLEAAEVAKPRLRMAERSDSAAMSDCVEAAAVDKEIKNVVVVERESVSQLE